MKEAVNDPLACGIMDTVVRKGIQKLSELSLPVKLVIQKKNYIPEGTAYISDIIKDLKVQKS